MPSAIVAKIFATSILKFDIIINFIGEIMPWDEEDFIEDGEDSYEEEQEEQKQYNYDEDDYSYEDDGDEEDYYEY